MGIVYNIQRFSLHDGPGIRTVVFLKGCPLNCAWCHNPESQKKNPQIAYSKNLCIDCGCCKICAQGVFQDKEKPRWDLCKACGQCQKVCPTGALELIGEEKNAEEVIDVVLRDAVFYQKSGGGLTISGGEPTMQSDFVLQLLTLAKKSKLHTAIETCGDCSWDDLEKLLPCLDLILYDMKCIDEQQHIKFTGKGNSDIKQNLIRLIQSGANIHIRIPVIPGYTDSPKNIEGIGLFLKSINFEGCVELLAYNELAGSKYPRLGVEYKLNGTCVKNGLQPKILEEILIRQNLKTLVRE